MRFLLNLPQIAACVLVAGCVGMGDPIRIDVERNSITGILPGEQITIILTNYRRNRIEVKDLGSIEEAIESCIRGAMQTINEKLEFLPPARWRKLTSTNTILTASQWTDLVLRSLGETATAGKLAEANVRYLLLLEVEYDVGERQWAGVVGYRRTQSSIFRATILDLDRRAIAGYVTSSTTGEEAVALALFVGPVLINSMSESRACAGLGEALVQFITDLHREEREKRSQRSPRQLTASPFTYSAIGRNASGSIS